MTRSFMQTMAGVVTLLTILLLWHSPTLAHKVNIFAYVENGVVHTESYFPDGKKVEGGVIVVFDKAGAKLLDGQTDRDGRFSFPLPPLKDDLNISLNASMGHKSTFLLKKGEM